MSDHLGLDFDLVEFLSAVDGHNAADHLGDNDHVTEMGPDGRGLLIRGSSSLSSAELLDQTTVPFSGLSIILECR